MTRTTVEYQVNCKRCGKPINYSGRMYEKIAEFGQSRPEYCEECRKILLLEKMTMGAAYFTAETNPGEDLSIAIPGELGMVYHPPRPHIKKEKPETFDASKFGATPDKVVELYKWLKDKRHQVAIIVGNTGSGKSTALPYWLMNPPEGVPDDFFIRDGQILITQPRIVATTSIAEYMGVLMGSSVGKGFDIGYRYSKDRNADRWNAAFLATDGSLLNMIKNGQLADLSVIMIDEAHERSLNIDSILRILRDQLPLYPHLKLLIVSATINQQLFLDFFGEDTAKVIEFEAKRKFDYKVFFAEPSEALDYEHPTNLRKQLVPAVVKKVTWLLKEQVEGRKTRGHVLAFLHGVKPIEEAVSLIRKNVESDPKLKDKIEVFPLYSDLPETESDYALKGKDPKRIRGVVCTNVAEASVTVEGTVYVVETGVENQANWDMEALETKVQLHLISQANAQQRWGRSGRTAPGEVHCTYTEAQYKKMAPFPTAAIQRSSMDEIILLLKDLGIDEVESGWIETPREDELKRSYNSLQSVQAIDEDGMLTEYGALLREFQYSASLTDLIVLSDRFGCAIEIASILPVIKTGGFKRLLKHDEDWDRKTRDRVTKLHQSLMANCHDDVEFILKLYSLWENPPELKKNAGKQLSLGERRRIWADEYFVDFDAFTSDIEPEKESILSLLSKHKKDRNLRPIDFQLVDRVRMILAYCLPFTTAAKPYVFSTKENQLALTDERKTALKGTKDKGSLLSLAKKLIDWEKDSTEELETQLREGADRGQEEFFKDIKAAWQESAVREYPVGKIVEGTVRSIIKHGFFVSFPDKAEGFVHIGDINPTAFINDLNKILKIGETVRAVVIGHDAERSQLKLSLIIPENRPVARLKPSQLIEGIVSKVTDYGAFVDLYLGYSGLIHVSKFGRRVNRPGDLLKIGDRVQVEVLEIREENGKTKINLRLVKVLV